MHAVFPYDMQKNIFAPSVTTEYGSSYIKPGRRKNEKEDSFYFLNILAPAIYQRFFSINEL